MDYVVYVLYSVKYDRLYVGYTSDLISRFNSHNYFAKSGYTLRFRPWEVAYVEFCETKAMVMKREKELKSSRGRAYIRESVLRAGFISVG